MKKVENLKKVTLQLFIFKNLDHSQEKIIFVKDLAAFKHLIKLNEF